MARHQMLSRSHQGVDGAVRSHGELLDSFYQNSICLFSSPGQLRARAFEAWSGLGTDTLRDSLGI
jgi:hypothetical protein